MINNKFNKKKQLHQTDVISSFYYGRNKKLNMENKIFAVKRLTNFRENEYYRNKYLAKIFRKERKFSTALKYYAAAQIHLNYFKMITSKSEII